MNFLPDSPTAANFVINSLEVLHDECPPAYAGLCDLMNGREILIHIDRETIPLRFRTEGISWLSSQAGGDSGLQVQTSAQAILELADAHLTLIDAVLESLLDLKGSAADLILLYEAILTYLRGAVRCPSFPALLDQFRLAYRLNYFLPLVSPGKLTTEASTTIISPT